MFRVPALLLLLVGCKYTPPGQAPTDGTVATDVTITPDSLPDPNLCTDTVTASCLGNVLRKCEEIGEVPLDTPCAICVSAPTAHCETLVPAANGATAVDLAPDGNLIDITITNNANADTDSGEITGVRPGGEGVLNGIGFRVVNNIAVWRFHSLTINESVDFSGGRAAVFAANRTIDVNDSLDLRGDCILQNAGPGGSSGGIAEQDGGGGNGRGRAGAGVPDNASGGSGGGHGVAGSGGAASTGQAATTGGGTLGDAAITMLHGGAGGGGGGGEPLTAGVGGGGGGAIHLVANDRITFGMNGGINAGGCGAARNIIGQNAGGAGGGSGGTILLEAVAVDLSSGVLAVNGGGGSGGDGGGQNGGDAQLSRTAAGGGAGTGAGNGTTGGRGGAGGAAMSPSGVAGASGSSNLNGGGGGGGIGRIRINTRDDLGLAGTCALCSPNFNDTDTTTSRGSVQILELP